MLAAFAHSLFTPLLAQSESFANLVSLRTASTLLLWLTTLAVPLLLLALGRGQPTTVRRVYSLLAGVVAFGCATSALGFTATVSAHSWPGEFGGFAVAAGTWVAALVLFRFLPPALTALREESRTKDLERLRLLDAAVAASGDGVMVAEATRVDQPGLEIVFANPAFERMLGYTAEEAMGLSPSVLCARSLQPDEAASSGRSSREGDAGALHAIRSALRGTNPVRLELPNRRKDGSRVWAEWHVVPVADATGRYTHWVAVLRDTTERRQAQDRLRRAKDFLASLLEHVPVPVSVSDAADRYQLVNPAWERVVGRNREEVLGRTVSEVLPVPAAREANRRNEAVRASRGPVREESVIDYGFGPRAFVTVKFPLPGEDGQSTRVGAVSLDVTEQKLAADKIQQLNAELRGRVEEVEALIELSPVGIAVVEDPRRYTVHMNRVLRELLGAEAERDLTLTPAASRLRLHFRRAGRDVPTEELPIQQCLARGVPVEGVEFQVTCPDGRERVLVNSVRPLFGDDGAVRGCVSVYTDITDRVRSEHALRDRENLLRNVIENIPCGVFWKDRDAVYLGCNDQFARDHGRTSAGEITGRTDSELGNEPSEIEFSRACDQQVTESGKPVLNLEHTRVRAGVPSYLLTSQVPLRDAGGAVIGVLGTYQDITERKRLEDQLRQAQKMEAIGQLASGIAHDFNNLLTIIYGNAELIRDTAPSAARTGALIEDICQASDRAAVLIRQLLTFSRKQPTRPEVVDLNEVVTRLAGLLRRLLGARVVVRLDLAASPVRVRADRGHLEQVVMNLAVNARDAMPDGGPLVIATADATRPAGEPDQPPVRVARLTVTDAGCGMSADVRKRIFEPFFTTKGPDRGTGLGLATVFGIVQQASGWIEVESTLGVGTTFRVELPWCASLPTHPATFPARGGATEPALPGGRSVLVVEDESSVRKYTRFALEAGGHSVVEAEDGEAALALAVETPTIDVLVTDLTMPGIDGCELASRLMAERPRLGVVVTSGYLADTSRVDAIPRAVFLPKPFTQHALSCALEQALRASQGDTPGDTGASAEAHGPPGDLQEAVGVE